MPPRQSPDCSFFTPIEARLVARLRELGQDHLFSHWPAGKTQLANKQRQLAELAQFDREYPGGFNAYIERARSLFQADRQAQAPFRGYAVARPSGTRLCPGTPHFEQHHARGLAELHRTAFVLVAGGLGERLGSRLPKVALPADGATGRTYLELFFDHLCAFAGAAYREAGRAVPGPLAIMTSGKTHNVIAQLLADNDYFGLSSAQVTLLEQPLVPAFARPNGQLAQDANDPYGLVWKPHGHGDVHRLLHRSGLAKRWHAQGLEHVVFFQDSNILALNAVPVALGVSVEEGLAVNSVAVPRLPGEAIGALAQLRKDGEERTLNIEYNQLTALREQQGPATEIERFPGSINLLVFHLPAYAQQLEGTEGHIPEFVNPKYLGESRTQFATPARLECLMQDYPRTLPSAARVGYTELPREFCFSAAKNSPDTARERRLAGLPEESLRSAEAALYRHNRTLLRQAGATVPEPLCESGAEAPLFPIVSLSAALVLDLKNLKHRLQNLRLSERSSLVVRGNNLHVDGLDLDGALVLDARGATTLDVRSQSVVNAGWHLRHQDKEEHSATSEGERLRGYCLELLETRTLRSNSG